MERDTMLSQGSSVFLRERLFYMSDPYSMYICKKCGLIANSLDICSSCRENNLVLTEIPNAARLLFQDLMAMNIKLKINPETF